MKREEIERILKHHDLVVNGDLNYSDALKDDHDKLFKAYNNKAGEMLISYSLHILGDDRLAENDFKKQSLILYNKYNNIKFIIKI